MGILMTNVIQDRGDEPSKSSISQSNSFQFMLQEERGKAKEAGKGPPAIGAAHEGIFHSFIQGLVTTDCGAKHKDILKKWLQDLESEWADNERSFINQSCMLFQVFTVKGQPELCRLQFHMPTGSIRAAVLGALGNLQLKLTSGPAPRGYLEEELADWMGQLRIDKE